MRGGSHSELHARFAGIIPFVTFGDVVLGVNVLLKVENEKLRSFSFIMLEKRLKAILIFNSTAETIKFSILSHKLSFFVRSESSSSFN